MDLKLVFVRFPSPAYTYDEALCAHEFYQNRFTEIQTLLKHSKIISSPIVVLRLILSMTTNGFDNYRSVLSDNFKDVNKLLEFENSKIQLFKDTFGTDIYDDCIIQLQLY